MLKGKRVLVIDDSEAERMLITTYLQPQGCRVYHAHDGLDGIHKARLISPDIILMDVDMPRCDGYAACKALIEEPQTADVPVVFLSAYSNPEQRVQGLIAGGVDYIAKPFDFDEVRLRLSIHLRYRGGREHNQEPGAEQFLQAPGQSDNYLNSVLFHSARVHLLRSLDEAPGIQALARLVGTNTKRLNAAFKACAGVTVYEYLREERMKEARQLLRNTGYSINEIAVQVGFSSSANFATAFRERFGLTPSRFRQVAPSPDIEQ